MRQPPSGTVTFLFTDIEGSTRLWEERPDEMRAALARHDEILRATIEGNGGYVFATGGDGFAAAFARLVTRFRLPRACRCGSRLRVCRG
jgi:class 3 adenylate cyclase